MNGLLQHLIYWSAALLGLSMTGGTLLGISRHPHWFVRGWDFPRLQISLLAAASLAVIVLFWGGRWYDWGLAATLTMCLVWQAYNILPFTPLWRPSVKRTRAHDPRRSLRLAVSNVLMDNEAYEKWLAVIRETEPDLILAVEVNQRWWQHIRVLEDEYPYVLHQLQENYYGMVLFSRFELSKPNIRCLVQDDVPSIHTDIYLPSGEIIDFHGVHPRPPEPGSDQDSVPRDAEVVLLGREIQGQRHQPRIIAGDFNDVAWSRTTDLFMKLSGLLDPRRGRGFYNSFDANRWYFRFPLDHVFHSNDFKLVDLRRLSHVGSDHFPILVELALANGAADEQPAPSIEEEDREDADDMVARADARGEFTASTERPGETHAR